MAKEGEKEQVKLLGVTLSPFVVRVCIALSLKGVDYEFIQENFMHPKSELLLKSNHVHKKVPVLIHNGKPVCESMIIVQYIEEAWGNKEPNLMPKDPYDRAIARFWAAFVDDKTLAPLRFVDNTRLILADPSLRSVPSRQLSSIKEVVQYTSIQIACTLVIFATSKTPAAIIFPLFILLMIWVHHCPLHSLFIKKGLDKLDSKLSDEQPKIQTPAMKIFNNPIFNNPHARGHSIHRRASQNRQNRQNNKVGCRKTMEVDQTPDQSLLLWNNNNPNSAVLPPATKRRLNEQRSRRNKRMKKTLALDSSHHCDVNPPLHTIILPLPCRYKLKNPQEQEEEESFSFTPSRSIMKQMSTQLILKPKNSFELQNPIEMHSNILYDPGPNDPPNTDPIINLSPARSTSKPNRGDCVDYTTDDETMIKVLNSQSSPYPRAQTQQNNVLNQRKEGSTSCAPAVVPEIRPLPKPINHDIFPMEGRIQPKKKIINVIDDTSRRTRMILNQRRWPSNKPMPSASKGPDGG